MTDMCSFLFLRNRLVVGFCLLTFTSPSVAGVVIGATRLVIHESAGQKDVHLKATGTNLYLVTAHVLKDSAQEARNSSVKVNEFSVLPPAFVIKGGKERYIRIITRQVKALPRDREKMFYFMVSSVPESNKDQKTVQIAVRTWIKLFYRPVALDGLTAPALSVVRKGDSVVMKNVSPFYISISGIFLQGHPVNSSGDVPPYGEKQLKGCSAPTPCEVKWMQTTNDNRLTSHQVSMGI